MPKHTKAKRAKRQTTLLWQVFQAALIACFTILLLLVVSTFMLSKDWIGEDSITLVNTCLKIIGSALAGLMIGRKVECRTWLCGGISAALFLVLSVGAMYLFLGEIMLSWGLLGDLMMSIAIGASIAVMVQILKRKKS